LTVAELIQWLQTQHQYAIVNVVAHSTGSGYYDQGGNARIVEFDPIKHVDYSDWTSDGKPHELTKEILLGEFEG